MSLVDITLPTGQQEGTRSVIGTWLKNVGDFVNLHQPICEIGTDKVVVEIAAPASGVIKEILKKPLDEIVPGDVLGRIDTSAQATDVSEQASWAAEAQSPHKIDSVLGDPLALSPAVKRILKDNNLRTEQISGTGKDGRITFDDVVHFIEAKGAGSPSSDSIPGKRVAHGAMRRSIASHMTQSVQRAPHVTSVFQADLSAVIAHRDKSKASFDKDGVALTFTSYFVRAAAIALNAVPEVNSRWHEDGLEIFNDCNIGIAVGLDDNLVVPVVMKAQNLDLKATAAQLAQLTTKARDGKLEPKDVQNGTFTISNHGVSGSLLATPIIINQPQSAILGIGKLEKRVIVRETDGKDVMEIRPMMYVTLTIDHRVLDGFKANAFLTSFVGSLEGWS